MYRPYSCVGEGLRMRTWALLKSTKGLPTVAWGESQAKRNKPDFVNALAHGLYVA
jgi:hypothetical protein